MSKQREIQAAHVAFVAAYDQALGRYDGLPAEYPEDDHVNLTHLMQDLKEARERLKKAVGE